MAPLLLVIGALMSGAGLYAVFYGYSIIQLEQGWASVISGATLVAGGVVTIALGLVLRVLKQVKTGLLDLPPRVQPEPNVPASDVPAVDTAPAPLAVTSPQHDLPLPDVASRAAETEHVLSPALAEHAAPVAPASRPGAVYEPTVSPPPALSPHAPVKESYDASGETSFFAKISPIPSAQPEPVVGAPHPADDYKLETPSTAAHDLPPPDRQEPAKSFEEPPSPAMDDWLDRAFAELDRDNPPMPPRTADIVATKSSPAHADPEPSGSSLTSSPSAQGAAAATLEPEPEPAGAAPVPAAPEPASPSAPASPQPSAPPPSAIIGRYESDGTTYVMFADGSIEAQSASGVYRFASMAELKAYIEA